MYLMISSRPDIVFAVSQVSQFCENSVSNHWAAVRRIFAYLNGTLTHGMRFCPSTDGLKGFTVSDYVGYHGTPRSTTGFLLLLHGGPIAWCSRRQSCVALSTTESEFVAACEATKKGIWLRRLMMEIDPGSTKPVPIMCDNQSAIQ